MFSRLPKDRTLEREDKIKYKKYSPPVPHLLQAQQVLALLYAKVAGRPGTGSYPAPSPSPTTQTEFGELRVRNKRAIKRKTFQNTEGFDGMFYSSFFSLTAIDFLKYLHEPIPPELVTYILLIICGQIY